MQDEAEHLFYSRSNIDHSSEDTWYLDSGCSHHITGDRRRFLELDERYSSHVELGDIKQLQIEGKGVIEVHTGRGINKHICDVFYSPHITQNLLSVGQMMKKGYKLIFDEDHCEILDKKNNEKVATVKMTSNNMFPLNFSHFVIML